MENEEKLGKLPEVMRQALEEIILRCEKANIEYKWENGFFEEYELNIYIQDGARKRGINVDDDESAVELLDSDFDKHVFVEGYEAICCYKEGYVEAVVGLLVPIGDKARIVNRITGIGYEEAVKKIKAGEDVRLELEKGDGKGLRVSIGKPSKTLVAMTGGSDEEGMSVRVEGLKITKNVEAAKQLGRVTASLFFELRKKRNISLFVRRYYKVELSTWPAQWTPKVGGRSRVSFPKFEYEKQPIELYWHAVGAYKMPLLQYLAYYQILEYYFAKFSMLGAKKEVQHYLKDPEFNVDNDNDITKIVTCISGKLGRYVSENDMLRDTIRECVSEEELVSEMSRESFKGYFGKEYKIVSPFKVSGENRDNDILKQLADRIYDIRCRIVHTKEGEKRGRIMPFTEEEELLRRFDLPMIADIANKVLIANSTELSF